VRKNKRACVNLTSSFLLYAIFIEKIKTLTVCSMEGPWLCPSGSSYKDAAMRKDDPPLFQSIADIYRYFFLLMKLHSLNSYNHFWDLKQAVAWG
jgi:hypothetical protein